MVILCDLWLYYVTINHLQRCYVVELCLSVKFCWAMFDELCFGVLAIGMLVLSKMDRRRGPGGPFFNSGDPFSGFGGFGGAGSPGDFMSSFFGGRSPFDDPFFTRPLGGMLQPGFLGSGGPFPFPNFPQGGFLENQVQPNRAGGSFPFPNFPQDGFPESQVQTKSSRGPIIEEINSESDDEKEENDEQKNVKYRKHRRSNTGKEPYVEEPDEVEGVSKGSHVWNFS